jgi:hypothetical protein
MKTTALLLALASCSFVQKHQALTAAALGVVDAGVVASSMICAADCGVRGQRIGLAGEIALVPTLMFMSALILVFIEENPGL